jgi:5-formyltetrahydrofolate cyclo-ligase
MDKSNHRRTMKETLSLIDEVCFAEMSSLVSKNLSQLFSELNVIQQKMCIGAFASIAKEPHLDLLRSKEIEKLTAYPVCDSNQERMAFKMARMDDLVIKRDFGPKILGPDSNAPEVAPGLILIPGLAFTVNGERLGRGKGFYDKYLCGYHGLKIGICFSVQVVSLIPTEKHDVLLDYIVTEKKIIKCERA